MNKQFKKTAFIFLIGLLASVLGITGYEIVWDEDHVPEEVREGDGFQPMSFAEINALPAKDCNAVYRVKADVLLTYPLNLQACQTGAPCNCCGVVPIPYALTADITVPDRPYTEEELLSKVKSPYSEYLIGKWHNVRVYRLPSQRPCKDFPDKQKPGKLEGAVQG